jgi:hypothetical protein
MGNDVALNWGEDMRSIWIMAIAFAIGCATTSPASAELSDCDNRIIKFTGVLTGLIEESKPRDRCGLAQWGVRRYNEILKMYNAEPAECKKTDLGKTAGTTIRSLANQYARDRRRFCRRR